MPRQCQAFADDGRDVHLPLRVTYAKLPILDRRPMKLSVNAFCCGLASAPADLGHLTPGLRMALLISTVPLSLTQSGG